jgi:hypothetical protein
MAVARVSSEDRESVSFLTPYWKGAEMMRIHLESLRRFHPTAPILVSAREASLDEMEAYRRDFGIRYWAEDCSYVDAFLRLLDRAVTDYVCIMDHDTILLSSLDHLVAGIRAGDWDLVGIEERIREVPDDVTYHVAASSSGWLRFRPGYTDATLLLFDWRRFRARWGLRGVRANPAGGERHMEYHYGICEKLERHHYLMPYHTRRYGVANLIRDGDVNILWHQWYGSYRTRFTGSEPEPALLGAEAVVQRAARGEAAFLRDYPKLDLSELTPAWCPGCDMEAERAAVARELRENAPPPAWSRWIRRSPVEHLRRAIRRADRWRRMR